MGQIEEIISRVDDVLTRNKRTEWLLISGTTILFLFGIASLGTAVLSGQYLWAIPSAFTTLFLKWPIEQIQAIRRGNIALALAPLLIRELPPLEAAAEIQKLLEKLFKDTV
jgi:hypothetical protein